MKLTELLSVPLTSLHTVRETKLCLDSLHLEEDDATCEIGVGSGVTSLLLSRKCRRVVAVDVSAPLIQFLKDRPHPTNLEFFAVDGTKPAPKKLADQFDKCICIDVMEHVEDPAALLAFISTVLKNRGRAAITFPINNLRHGRHYFTKDNLLDLVARSGLETQTKILKLDRLGSILEKVEGRSQGILIKRNNDTNEFDGTVCFEMMRKPKRIHALYKLGISLLFKIHESPFYESGEGNRALLLVQKE